MMAFALPELLGALMAVIALSYWHGFITQQVLLFFHTLKIPRVGLNPWLHGSATARDNFYYHARSIVADGYRMFRNGMFRVQTVDMERIIVSPAYADELRKLPEEVLSITEALCGRYLGWYTSLDIIRKSNLHVDACHRNMASKLGSLVQGEMGEMAFACALELKGQAESSPDEFQYLEVYPKLFAIANRVVSRSLVGSDICRNETWLQANLGYIWNVFMMSRSLRRYPALLRPFAYYFSKERTQVQKTLRLTRELLVPMIESRVAGEDHHDILQWMIDIAGPKERESPDLVARLLLILSVAGINTTASAVTHNLLDLCAMPEVVEPLRTEIDAALKSKGGWTLAALQEMVQLDSFVRESSRMNFPGLFTFNRKVLQQIRLSDGKTLPSGSYVALPAGLVARDPSIYESPDEFRPWRFADLRKQNPGEAGNRYQFSSSNKENFLWGYGVATCPGRLLAATHVKAMVAYIILHYDLALPPGTKARPHNLYEDERCIPKRDQLLGFRSRYSDI